MNIFELIRQTPLFRDIDIGTIEELAQHCHQKNYHKAQHIFGAGDKADFFFVIMKGWVKLFRVSREGEEAVINVFGPRESFAEAAVFREQRSYPVNGQAATDAILIEIPHYFFIQKIKEDGRFALRILASISSHQHYLVRQIEQVTTRTAPQRIGAFLLQFCDDKNIESDVMTIDLPYDKSLISTRLNIKPETFSRALAKLEPYGVDYHVGQIKIHDPKRLAEFCDVII
ncbi:MAG: Crp/Fnr family transcriptional regulator [Pseudomonadota bacterium]